MDDEILRAPPSLWIGVAILCFYGLVRFVIGWIVNRTDPKARAKHLAVEADALLIDADNSSGEDAAALLRQACEKCERAFKDDRRNNYNLHVWGVALMRQGRMTAGAEAERLFEKAEEKLIAALAITPREPVLRNNLNLTHLYRAIQSPRATAVPRLTRVCEECETLFRENPQDALNLHNWGSALIRQAGIELADHLYRSAEQKFIAASTIAPDNIKFRNQRIWTILLRADLNREETGVILLQQVRQECEDLLRRDPPDNGVFIEWGAAIIRLIHRAPAAEAERLCAEAEERFTRYMAIAPNNENLVADYGLVLENRARLQPGLEADRIRARAIGLFDELIRKNPRCGFAMYYRAHSIRKMAENDEGEEARRRVLDAIRQLDTLTPADAAPATILESRGVLLWALALCNEGERTRLLNEAKATLSEGELRMPRSCAYCLACVHALLGEIQDCRHWLEVSHEPGIRITQDHLAHEPALESVRGLDWFRALAGLP